MVSQLTDLKSKKKRHGVVDMKISIRPYCTNLIFANQRDALSPIRTSDVALYFKAYEQDGSSNEDYQPSGNHPSKLT